MNAIGVALYILDMLQVNKDDGKIISVLVVVHYIIHVFILDDFGISMLLE